MEYLNEFIEHLSNGAPGIFIGILSGIIASIIFEKIAKRSDFIRVNFKIALKITSLLLEFLGNTPRKDKQNQTSKGENR